MLGGFRSTFVLVFAVQQLECLTCDVNLTKKNQLKG